jgi:hypothetical protein
MFFFYVEDDNQYNFKPCDHYTKTAYQQCLFSTETDENTKPIAVDGAVNYYGSLMSPAKANEYLAEL